jgi:p-aminobenzoyl-glutamate transporter AbgT
MNFKKVYLSVTLEAFYSILIVFGIRMELVRLIKMCLIETSSADRVGTLLSDMCPIKKALKQGDSLLPLLYNFFLNMPLGGFR